MKNTHQKLGIPGPSPSSPAGFSIHRPCRDLQSLHSWRDGFLLVPTLSDDAIFCSEHPYTLKSILVTSPRVIMKHKSVPWRQGHYGNFTSRRWLHFLMPAITMAPEAVCFMVHFRIDDPSLNFWPSTCLNMKESRPHSFLYHTQVYRMCQSTMLKSTKQTSCIYRKSCVFNSRLHVQSRSLVINTVIPLRCHWGLS